MISYIKGKLVYKEATFIIVDVGGLGYEVKIPLSTYTVLGDQENCFVHTHLQIKEDSHTLYGFATSAEKEIFLELISISGVGPSTGLTVLSQLTVDEVYHAITHEDVATIQSVKGIGVKSAQRIILELKDKLRKRDISSDGSAPSGISSKNQTAEEAISALVTLGYQKTVAEKTVAKILKLDASITLENLIRQALKSA